MVKINYIRECERFMEYAMHNSLSPGEHLLWRALFHLMNSMATGTEWPDGPVPIKNNVLLAFFPASEDTLARSRKALHSRGLITFTEGNGNKRPPSYQLHYLTANCDHPANAPQTSRQSNPQNAGIISQTNSKEGKPDDTSHVLCYDNAWRTSERVRNAVAQRIIDRWKGERGRGYDIHWEIVYYMSMGMTPETIERVMKNCVHACVVDNHLQAEAIELGLIAEM